MEPATTCLNFGGRDLTHYLTRLLEKFDYPFLSANSKFLSRQDIKEKFCYVALDFDQEMTSFMQSSMSNECYKLPDGQLIELSTERFRCPEALFQPTILGIEADGELYSLM